MLLSVKGVYKNGRVELEQADALPEGEVLVVFLAPDAALPQDLELAKHRPEEHKPKRWLGRVRDTATAVGTTVGSAAVGSGHFVAGTASGALGAAENVASRIAGKTADAGAVVSQNALPLFIGFTSHAGDAVEMVVANPTLRQAATAFKLEHWLDVSEHVDVEEAQEVVARLKADFPDEHPRQIAQRLMAEKAKLAATSGFLTSVVPGTALPLMVVDVAATSLLQAELVLQIAAAYDLDLEDPARKGEVLAVFGCVLGASRVAKAGLAILKNAPVAGAVIGATANAGMLYALGHVACRFYEEKLHLEASHPAMRALQQENELLLEEATRQQAVADQILVHVVLAGSPCSSREEVLLALEPLNLSPASLEAIAVHLHHPRPLDDLFAELEPEFAAYVLIQCQRIAELNGVVTEAEAAVIEEITRRFE